VVASGPLGTRKAFTRPDGTFLLTGLRPGAYRVEYRGCSPVGKFTGQYYGGPTISTAAKVLVTGAGPTELGPVTLQTLGSLAARRARMSRPAPALRPLSAASRAELNAAEAATGQLPSQAARGSAGHISGRVTVHAGRPLAKACVLAAQRFGRSVYLTAEARTSAAGRYSLRLRPGRYYIDFLPTCARHGNYAPQLWRAAGSIGKATVVRVLARHTVTGVNASLGVGAQVTGRVRTHVKNPHPPLGGICVIAVGTKGQRLFEGIASTAKNGSFTLRSLATGTYRLFVEPQCARSAVWLPSSRPFKVKVTDGKTTSGVTTWVKLGGAISGAVKDTHGHPLGGICVSAQTQNTGSGSATMANGTYRIPDLAPGSYQVAAGPGCGNNGPYATVVLPNPVTVLAGAVTAHVNVVLPADGSLTGVVKNAHGQPLSGICVEAQGSGFAFSFAKTEADGSYTMKKVSPGSYQVTFVPGGVFYGCGNTGNYLPATLNATVASGAATTLDAVLPTGGTISGTVTDPHGKPLSGVCVFSNSEYGGQAVSAADGRYRLDQLFSGRYYVGFEGGCGNHGSVAPQAYRDDPTFYGPASVSVTQGAMTSGIDVRLKPGATITGRVTDQAGHRVSGVCVTAFPETGAGADGTFATRAIDRNGRFSAANLPPGQYNLIYSGIRRPHHGCSRSPYADWQFSNQGAGAFPDLISARGGKVTSGADAALPLAGRISGVVTDRAGHGLRNMCVQATTKSGSLSTGFTAGNGSYAIGGLAPGRYKVEFTGCGGDFIFFGETGLNYASQWYKDKTTARSATIVTVRPGKTTGGIDGALARGGSVSGQVVYRPNHRPISFVCVYAFAGASSAPSFGLTDRLGHYLVDGLSTGRYFVEYTPCSGESALASELRSNVHVVAGQRTRGVSESLPLGGSVSGVTSALVNGHAHAAPATCVELIPLGTSGVGGLALSFQGGAYTATGLAPGRYVALAGVPGCSSDAPALSVRQSGTVRVASGKTTSAVNLTLATTGAISGTVRRGGHAVLGGICAEAYPVSVPGGAEGYATGVTSQAKGGYLISDLQPGTYKVRFTSGCGTSGYAARWYRNAGPQSRARVVRVRAATTTTGINVSLLPAPTRP
jgi:Carboxypeptidase regulatory-like domain